jgi:hypothetical protein
MVFVIILAQNLVLQNSRVAFYHIFQLLLQLNQVSCGCWHYWGRPICFARNFLLMWHDLVPEVSVPISVFLMGVKKFRVTTSMGAGYLRWQLFRPALLVFLKIEFPIWCCALRTNFSESLNPGLFVPLGLLMI